MKKLTVISGWASDSLACQEVRTAAQGFLREPTLIDISFVSSTPSTIHTGFLVRQVVETEERYGRPLETVILQDADPLLEPNAELLILRLRSGIHVLGPNVGYGFSFLHDKIDVAFTYPGMNKEGQFRSRDLYARIAAHLMEAREDEMALEEAHLSMIPRTQDDYIGHIDSLGNMKTTIKKSIFEEKHAFGDTVDIEIGSTMHTATYHKNLFTESDQELVIYPGSSGDSHDPFLEISASERFDKARSGMKVLIT